MKAGQKVDLYDFTLQVMSRDEDDGGFVAEAHVRARLRRADLDLPFERFVEQYLRPAFKQAMAEHDRQLALVEEAANLKPGDRVVIAHGNPHA